MGSKLYETPPDFFRARWELHHFTVDAAASDANALVRPHAEHCVMAGVNVGGSRCEYWQGCVDGRYVGRYFTEETNGLDPAHYVEGDRVWCNPPYDLSILGWVAMFRELQDAGVMAELLLPASTSTRWFTRYLWNDKAGHWRDGVEGHFIGRVQFWLNGQPIRDASGKRVSSRQDNLLVTLPARGHS